MYVAAYETFLFFSCYMALSGESLESLVKPELRERHLRRTRPIGFHVRTRLNIVRTIREHRDSSRRNGKWTASSDLPVKPTTAMGLRKSLAVRG